MSINASKRVATPSSLISVQSPIETDTPKLDDVEVVIPKPPDLASTVSALPVSSNYGYNLYGGGTAVTMSSLGMAMPAFTPTSNGQITEIQIYVLGVAGSTLDVALYSCNSSGEPGDKINDLASIDCSSSGSVSVVGLSEPVNVGSVYRIATAAGAIAPSVYARSSGTAGFNRGETMTSPFIASNNQINNLSRGGTWRTTGGLTDSPSWSLVIISMIIPNMRFKIEPV